MIVNWFLKKCGRYEEELSLLAVNGLEAERAERVRKHLEGCASCRNKFSELRFVAVNLKREDKDLPRVQASERLRRRWTKAVHDDARKESEGSTWAAWFAGPKLAWSSIAVMWALVLFFRFSGGESPKVTVAASAPNSLREVLLALKVETVEPQRARGNRNEEKKPVAPQVLPPHSEKYSGFQSA